MKFRCFKINLPKYFALTLSVFLSLLIIPPICPAEEPGTLPKPEVTTTPGMEAAKQANQDTTNVILNTYTKHRQKFLERKEAISQTVEKEHEQLVAELRELEAQVEQAQNFLTENSIPSSPTLPIELQRDLQRVDRQVNSTNSLRFFLSGVTSFFGLLLAPMASGVTAVLGVFGIPLGSIIFAVALSFMVLNFFLFLVRCQKIAFQKWKGKLVILLIVTFIASATSVLADQAAEKRQDIETNLRYAEDLLSKSGNQKAIAILEEKKTKVILLPAVLQSKDPILWVESKVSIDTAEYYITLAALYDAEGYVTKAVDTISKIIDNKGTSTTPGARAIVAGIHYLVEKSYKVIAGKLITNYADSINNSKTLLDLFAYLRTKDMQVSSDYIRELVIKKTTTSSGFLALTEYYLESGEKDKAIETLQKALDICTSYYLILEVVKTGLKMEATDFLHKVPEKAKKLTGDIPQYIELAKIFSDMGESQFVEYLLMKTIELSISTQELAQRIDLALELNQESILRVARERALVLCQDIKSPDSEKFKTAYRNCLDLVDHLLKINLYEDANLLFKSTVESIKKQKKADEQFIPLMIDLAKDAWKRGFNNQTADIVFSLTFTIRPREKRYTTFFEPPPEFSKFTKELPDGDYVSMALFNGIMQEETSMLSEAEQVYMQAVLNSLQSIIDSYGEQLPMTLNEYYLLGRLWHREKRTDSLARLDRVYTLLEGQMLQKIKEEEREKVQHKTLQLIEKERQNLAALQSKVSARKAAIEQKNEKNEQTLNVLISEAKEKLKQKTSYRNGLVTKTIFKTIATICMVVILSSFFIGCAYLAWKFSRRMKEHMAYGFVFKFLELNGWLRLFSVLGCVSGIMMIIGSQCMLILQKIHEILLFKNSGPAYIDYKNDLMNLGRNEKDVPDQKK